MKTYTFKSTIFKILALYVITSGIFLLIFFFTLFEKESDYIRLNQLTHMHTHYNYILQNINASRHERSLLFKNDYLSISKRINTPFALTANGYIIFSNLSEDPLKILNKLKENNYIYTQNKKLFVDFINAKNLYVYLDNVKKPKQNLIKFLKHRNMNIIIEANDLGFDYNKNAKNDNYMRINDFSNELLELKIKIISYALLCIVLLVVIAYFLIQLVFKNVKEQFNSLNNFIKDTTHEINTPLSVILTSIKKFDDKDLNTNNAKNLKYIKLASKNLNHIYQNLIAINFFTQQKSMKEKFDLKNILEQRLEYFDILISQKNLSIHKDIEQNFIYANKEEMQILLDNILSNAIKYTNINKNIFVSLKNNTLSIKDEGEGMDEEKISKIFKRYTRFNEAQGGFGIGLHLVKQIADKNDINIKVISKENEGSEFILSW